VILGSRRAGTSTRRINTKKASGRTIVNLKLEEDTNAFWQVR
jgi:hypothetical protein